MCNLAPASIRHFTSSGGKQFCNDVYILLSIKFSSVQFKPSDPEPEFCFEGNKKQYKLNCDVLDKIERAKNRSDDKSQTKLLKEREQLLLERNKHICLADNLR